MNQTRLSHVLLRLTLLASCLGYSGGSIFAQAVPVDVSGRSWLTIETEHYDIIFPEDQEEQAQYVADTVEYLFPFWRDTLKPNAQLRYQIMLLPDRVVPDGFVSVQPRRSAFYSTPYFTLPGDWYTYLAAHEGRHMTQLDALNRNTMGAARILMGDQIYVIPPPYWLLEGDAVITETIFTPGGRGRDPAFTAQAKALLLEGKTFDFHKALLGSDLDSIPDCYVLGYLLYAWLRERYAADAPEELFRALSWIPVPVIGIESAVRKLTGKNLQTVYEEMCAELTFFWKNQVSTQRAEQITYWPSRADTTFAQHISLSLDAQGAAVSARYLMDTGAYIERREPGKTGSTRLAFALPLNNLTSGGNFIAWDEKETDDKYDRSTSRIILFDIKSGSRRIFGSGGRFMFPELSPHGDRLALIEWKKDFSGRMVIFNTSDFSLLAERELPPGQIWGDLSWTSDGLSILGIANGRQGKALIRISADTLGFDTLLPESFENLRQPCAWGDTVLYVSNWSGIDTIWALEPDGRQYMVLERPLGAYSPNIDPLDKNRMVFIDYLNSRGTAIASTSLDRSRWIAKESVVPQREEFFSPFLSSEPAAGKLVPSEVPRESYETRKFNWWIEGNRADAWGLRYDPDRLLDEPQLGLIYRTDNIAGLMSHELTLDYLFNQDRIDFGYTFGINAFPPDLSLTLEGGWTAATAVGNATVDGSALFGMSLPIGSSISGGLSWSVVPGSSVAIATSSSPIGAIGSINIPIAHSVEASIGVERWGVAGAASYGWTPLEQANRHWRAALALSAPGLFRYDGLSVNGRFESVSGSAEYEFSAIPGYAEQTGSDTIAAIARYRVPLLFPDLSIGPIYYLRRIEASGFADREWLLSDHSARSAIGIELNLIGHPFQIPITFSIGGRFSYQLEEGKTQLDVLFEGTAFQLE